MLCKDREARILNSQASSYTHAHMRSHRKLIRSLLHHKSYLGGSGAIVPIPAQQFQGGPNSLADLLQICSVYSRSATQLYRQIARSAMWGGAYEFCPTKECHLPVIKCITMSYVRTSCRPKSSLLLHVTMPQAKSDRTIANSCCCYKEVLSLHVCYCFKQTLAMAI